MPVITERSLESGTVGDALARAWRATLPASLAESPSVDWVLSYGEQRQEADHATTRDWLRYSDRRGGLKWLAVGQLCRNLLAERLPTYVDALFLFGRPMRATELALHDCAMVIESEALSKISSQISQRLDATTQANEEKRLQRLASDAMQLHRTNLSHYEKVWKTWEQEVSQLQGLIQRVRERGRYDGDDYELEYLIAEIIDLQSRRSALPDSLAEAGISFDGKVYQRDIQPANFLASVLPSIGLLILATKNGRDSHFEYVIHRAVERIAEAEFEKAIAPKIKAEDDSLSAIYRDTDPFAAYDLGKGPPTLELLVLAKENLLSERRPSTWLNRWKSRLLHPGWKLTPPDFAERLTDDSVRWGALCADSMIKNKMIEENLGSASSMSVLIQKAFEQQWVQSFARSLIKDPGEGGQLIEGWNDEELSKYVSLVTETMNSDGYTLQSPGTERLRTLLEKALRGEVAYYSTDHDW